ncbi:hypothetical protein JQ625_15525 [Bradyrhizobium diazoefficiens]|nr:hypothetical protein [Bradyrhizobium diazoefficiens]
MGYGRFAAGIDLVALSFPPGVTAEGARSTIVRRQQEDHDGESEEEKKQEGQKGQEGRSGEEGFEEEGCQEDREEVGQENSQEISQEIGKEIGQEGRPEESGSQEGRSEKGSSQEGCKEGGAQEERGQGDASSSGGSAAARARARCGDELGDAVRRGFGIGRRLARGAFPRRERDVKQQGRGGDAAAFLHRQGLAR